MQPLFGSSSASPAGALSPATGGLFCSPAAGPQHQAAQQQGIGLLGSPGHRPTAAEVGANKDLFGGLVGSLAEQGIRDCFVNMVDETADRLAEQSSLHLVGGISQSPEHLMGIQFPTPFVDGEYGSGIEPYTTLELDLMALMSAIKEKP